jgi:hypothetical protein
MPIPIISPAKNLNGLFLIVFNKSFMSLYSYVVLFSRPTALPTTLKFAQGGKLKPASRPQDK